VTQRVFLGSTTRLEKRRRQFSWW